MDIEQSNLTIKDPLADLNGIAIASNSNKVNESKVHVALRVRRLISKEVLNREQRCVDCYPITNQVLHLFCHLNTIYSLTATFSE